jgi:hypothetical protein
MKIKDLGKCLEKAADHEDAKAAECHAEHKMSGMEDSHHGRMGDLHKASAANLRDCAAKCMKADDADDLSKSDVSKRLELIDQLRKRLEHLEGQIVPSRVSAITPNAPGARAVPRAGQPAFDSKPQVPTQFAKLVEIEE